MNRTNDLRSRRRSAARGMTMAAVAGIAGVLTLAAVAIWFSMENAPGQQHVVVDPMSMVG